MEDFRFLTPVELLELLRKQQIINNLPSTDYRLAKILGMTPVGLSHTLHEKGSLSDDNAIKLADELKLPRAYVVACMMRFRAKSDTAREMWEDVAAKSLKVGVFILLVAMPILFNIQAFSA